MAETSHVWLARDPAGVSLDGPTTSIICVIAVFVVLALLASLEEMWRAFWLKQFDQPAGRVHRAFRCFSLLSHSWTCTPDVAVHLGSVHGVQFVSIVWVITYHVWLSAPYRSSANDALNGKAWWAQGPNVGFLAVDSFLVVSGVLVTFQLLRLLECNRGRFKNIASLYIHRYLRLTPLYAIVIALIAIVVPRIPQEPPAGESACRSSWWTNLLYVNNFVTGFGTCIGQSWYLAVEMQLFLVAPAFAYLLWRSKAAGLAALFSASLLSIGVFLTVLTVYDMPTTLIYTRMSDTNDYMDKKGYLFMMKPWTKAPQYFVGILVGWLLFKSANCSQSRPLSKILVAVGWLLAVVVGLTSVYGLVPYLDEVKVPHVPDNFRFFFGPIQRPAWAAVVGWIIFACQRGHGGLVSRFLSWKGFRHLSRLSYCIFLIHLDVAVLVLHTLLRNRPRESFTDLFSAYFHVTFICMLVAVVLCSLIEMPLSRLLELYFPDDTREKESSSSGAASINTSTVVGDKMLLTEWDHLVIQKYH